MFQAIKCDLLQINYETIFPSGPLTISQMVMKPRLTLILFVFENNIAMENPIF